MKYIEYVNYTTSQTFEGVILKEDQNHFTICPLLAYLWSKHIKDPSLLHAVHFIYVSKNKFTYIEKQPIFLDDWIFLFPITKENRRYFHSIVQFFQTFLDRSILSFTRRVESAVEQFPNNIEKQIVKSCIMFVCEHFQQSVSSSKLQKYFVPNETIIYQHIYFSDGISGEFKQAFLLKEDEDFFYTVPCLLYQLLEKNNLLENLEKIEPFRYNKHWFRYKRIDKPRIDEWMLSFPVEEKDLEFIHSIVYFFETFQFYHDFPFVQRVEICARHKKFPISDEVMTKLIVFIGEQFKHERIRLLLYDELGKFLRK